MGFVVGELFAKIGSLNLVEQCDLLTSASPLDLVAGADHRSLRYRIIPAIALLDLPLELPVDHLVKQIFLLPSNFSVLPFLDLVCDNFLTGLFPLSIF